MEGGAIGDPLLFRKAAIEANKKRETIAVARQRLLDEDKSNANLTKVREDREKRRQAELTRRRGLGPLPAAPLPAAPDNDDQVRGITRRDHVDWLLFRAMARGDFKHDFGENVESRDKFDEKDENRFFEIAKLVSKKGSVELRAKFKSYIGKNPYLLIADQINGILPTGAYPDVKDAGIIENRIHNRGVAQGQFADEDKLLDLVGIKWTELKQEIVKAEKGVAITKKFAETAVEGGRTYQIRACPYRKSLDRADVDNYKTNTAPIEALGIVSGGKRNFALIVDASGGLPLSDLRDRALLTGEGGGKVYIIENIENGADSATKLLPPPLKPKGTGPGLPPAPDLKFLRDDVNTINYPLWAPSKDDQKSNIYSSLFIILNRISEGNVEANLLIKNPDGTTKESYSIGDIANTSNVKNSSLYTLALLIEKGRVTNEMLIYTLIKRMGDWCQALSLLDLDRTYTIYNDDKKTVSTGGGQTGGASTTTLRELQATTEIGIVTNDRILLAFCILLGLNVFYTSGMDIARLIYFKNTRDLPSGPALQAVVDALLATIDTEAVAGIEARIAAHETAILTARDAFITGRLATNDIADYILALRSLLSNLGRLRLDFTQSVAQVNTNAALLGIIGGVAITDESKRLTAANVLISVISKIDLDIKYNESVLADLANPANPSVDGKERIRLAALKQKLALGIRIPKSVEVTEAKTILSETRNDIRQILEKQSSLVIGPTQPLLRTDIFRTTPAAFGIEEKTNRGAPNYQELLSVFPAIMLLLPAPAGGQRGGGLEHINAGYDALGARTIRLLDTPGLEVTSTTNIYELGSSYYDAALNAYTVADEYIVTKDELYIFDGVFQGLVVKWGELEKEEGRLDKMMYICNRYLLLLIDIAWSDLDGMRQEEEESQETVKGVFVLRGPALPPTRISSGVFEPGTPARTRIHQIVEIVKKTIATLDIGDSGDLSTFIANTLELYSNPPTGEDETIVVTGLDEVEGGLEASRTRLIANIISYPVPDEERAVTITLEANVTANLTAVPLRVMRYSVPLVGRLAYDLRIINNNIVNEVEAESLGQLIEGALQRVGLDLAGTDQETASATTVVERGFASVVAAVINAVNIWFFSQPEGRRGDINIATITARIPAIVNQIRREEVASAGLQPAAPLPSNANGAPPGSSWRGGRRRLYAGLRKRGGSGSNPEL